MGKIEDSTEALQVDFANEYIGGGVLELGQVQVGIVFYSNTYVTPDNCVWSDYVVKHCCSDVIAANICLSSCLSPRLILQLNI